MWLGMRYRGFYSHDHVGMQGAGLVPVIIEFGRIELVRDETSVERGRPFRRVAVYPKQSHGTKRWVDVSLKHFRIEDIRGLLGIIKRQRPDLVVPEI